MRTWRQRLDPNGNLVFRRVTLWGDREYAPGDAIPGDLRQNRKKLYLLWESERIELADYEQPPGAMPQPEPANPPRALPPNVEKRGTWYWVTLEDGTVKKANGRAKLDALMAELDA